MIIIFFSPFTDINWPLSSIWSWSLIIMIIMIIVLIMIMIMNVIIITFTGIFWPSSSLPSSYPWWLWVYDDCDDFLWLWIFSSSFPFNQLCNIMLVHHRPWSLVSIAIIRDTNFQRWPNGELYISGKITNISQIIYIIIIKFVTAKVTLTSPLSLFNIANFNSNFNFNFNVSLSLFWRWATVCLPSLLLPSQREEKQRWVSFFKLSFLRKDFQRLFNLKVIYRSLELPPSQIECCGEQPGHSDEHNSAVALSSQDTFGTSSYWGDVDRIMFTYCPLPVVFYPLTIKSLY